MTHTDFGIYLPSYGRVAANYRLPPGASTCVIAHFTATGTNPDTAEFTTPERPGAKLLFRFTQNNRWTLTIENAFVDVDYYECTHTGYLVTPPGTVPRSLRPVGPNPIVHSMWYSRDGGATSQEGALVIHPDGVVEIGEDVCEGDLWTITGRSAESHVAI